MNAEEKSKIQDPRSREARRAKLQRGGWQAFAPRNSIACRTAMVAERPAEGSRGLQPTVSRRIGKRRGATHEMAAPRSCSFNRRSATELYADLVRGLKPTATFKASLREAVPRLNLSSPAADLALGSWSLSDVWILELGALNVPLRPAAPSLGCPPNT